jgi:hypothetical protein
MLSFIFITSIGAQSQDIKTYKFKCGIIKYKTQGRTNKTEVIYFDNYGKLISDETTSLSDEGSIEKTRFIIKNDSLLELRGHTIISKTKYNESANSHNKLISKETINSMGFEQTASENIAGCECEKYVGDNGKLWVWNNIILKSEMEIMGIKITTEATEVLIGIEIDTSVFDI